MSLADLLIEAPMGIVVKSLAFSLLLRMVLPHLSTPSLVPDKLTPSRVSLLTAVLSRDGMGWDGMDH